MGGYVPARALRDGTVFPSQKNATFRVSGEDFPQTRVVGLNALGTGFYSNVGPLNQLHTPFGVWDWSISAGTVEIPVWDDVNGKGLNLVNPATTGAPARYEFVPNTAITAVGGNMKGIPLGQPGTRNDKSIYFRVVYRIENWQPSTLTTFGFGLRGVASYLSTGNYANSVRHNISPGSFGLTVTDGGNFGLRTFTSPLLDNEDMEYEAEITPFGQPFHTLKRLTTGEVFEYLAITVSAGFTGKLNPTYYVPFLFVRPSNSVTLPILYLKEVEFGQRLGTRRG